MNSYTYIFFFCFLSHLDISQDEADMALLARNYVSVSYEYQLIGPGKNDTILTVEKHYNHLGRTTVRKDYKQDTVVTQKNYTYKNHFLNSSYSTYHRDTLFSKTVFQHDSVGRIIERVDYNHLGELNGYSETKEYETNQKGERIVTTKIYRDGDLSQHSRNHYANDCSLLSFTLNIDGEWEGWNYTKSSDLDSESEKTEYFENYKNSGYSVTVRTTPQSSDLIRHGSLDSVKVKTGDYIITESYYTQNGLLDFKIKKANSIVFDHLLYKYESDK